MDVHPPHGPIHSVKDFLLHLLAITVGLLIALGLEGSVEWLHHRHLVGHARENLALEIRTNQQNLARELNSLPAEGRQLDEILDRLGDVQNGRVPKPLGTLTWTVTRLNDSAWTTTFSTGAIAFMDYEEVQRYSRLYAAQQLFNATLERSLESRGQMYGFLARMNLPDKAPDAEFENGKRAITSQIVMDSFLSEMGGQLNTLYASFQNQPPAAEAK